MCICSSAAFGGNGELQAAGGSGAAVSECPPPARRGGEQPANLPHSADSAAGGQPAAVHYHPAVQRAAGRDCTFVARFV